jgi:Uma2 family endonuclease
MYIPSAAAPFVVQEDQGVWAPRIHQRIIARLTTNLTNWLENNGLSDRLEALPETMLDESKASPVPDLSIYDREANHTSVIIEVCHTDGLRGDLQKVIRLIDADLYGIREGFVYDYRTGQWLRYRFGDAGLTDASSHSDLLGLDLGPLA